ncbi:zinc finger, C3HC4 type (RING finger) domain-containing protein [Cryptosporidium felis]|nr:zinc finger, C3HC4 type (RING finger) domain-containing protein [Cryptosporidium felis]
MISKRRRDDDISKKSSVSLKNEELPLESKELTNYHVNQLQELNKQYRTRIEELEDQIKNITDGLVDIDDKKEVSGDEKIVKFKYLLEQKDDEILALRNENQRLNMQNVLRKSQMGGNLNESVGEGSRKTSDGCTFPNEVEDHSQGPCIDIALTDLKSKLQEKSKQISELKKNNEEIFRENLRLRRDFLQFVPCKGIENPIDTREKHAFQFCKCVEQILEEVSTLKNQLNSEKRKFAVLLENELFKKVRDFLMNQNAHEERTNAIYEELENIKDKYDSLKHEYNSLESLQKKLEYNEREYKKRNRELELSNSKMESERARLMESIKNINFSFEKNDKNDVIERLTSEYDELSTAFEEKCLECDALQRKLKELEKETGEYKIGIQEIKQSLKELETIKILYEEKISLIRKNTRVEPQKGLCSTDEVTDGTRTLKFMEKYVFDVGKETVTCPIEDFNAANKALIQQKVASEKLKLDLEFYKSENLKLEERLNSLEKEDANNVETINILRNRIQYILNKVNKLTNLKVVIDETEENAHLQIDDYDKEINHLKSENQQLLTLMKCSVCHDKVKDTVINRCGHLFCRECIDSNLSSRNRKCPLCHTTFDRNDTGRIFLY